MSEQGHGLQIVNINQNHSYKLNERELAQLLLKPEIKDLPVVVVSVAGAYRGGKTFLLNFFIRYLSSPVSARRDGSWLGEDSAALVGFKWRSGIEATTLGVLMWSEPFIITLASGKKVALLLMDTQGSDERRSSVRDSSTVFALATLMSSIEIYNLSRDIQEDAMQRLELFAEYGTLVNSGNGKSFQVLEFLVRDWQWPDENYPYGAVGGERLLQEKLAVSEDLPKEMKELKQQVTSSFEAVSCFLMPHPGLAVLRDNYHGKINEISRDFRSQLIIFVNSIFSPGKLIPKKINGEQVKARELLNYFKAYVELFNSSEILNPSNIFEATAKAVLLSAVGEARDNYEEGMKEEAGANQLGLPAVDVEFLHQKYVNAALQVYDEKKKLGTPQQFAEYRNNLNEELNKRLPQFLQSNLSKTQAAIEQAKDSYQKSIEQMIQPICLHNNELTRVHQSYVNAALKVYDGLIKRVTNKDDPEKQKLKWALNRKLETLHRENEQNNKKAINVQYMHYWQQMQGLLSRDPPLSEHRFTIEHSNVAAQALWDFDKTRNVAGSDEPDDSYKCLLRKKIADGFNDLRPMNNRRLQEIEEKKRAKEKRRREEEKRQRREEEQIRLEKERRQQEKQRQLEEERQRREREESPYRCSIS